MANRAHTPVAPSGPVLAEVEPDGAAVAVVVTRNPDSSFDDALASIAAQDHPALSILVIDDGSIEPVTGRVAAIVPSAFVRRHDEPIGYGAAANLVQQMVSGASFFVFCHDDVALAPDAIRFLARESVRSGAAIVGPKLVGWHDHERLLAVGVGMDRAGNAVPLVEHHERDQGQHDLPREVVATPGAAMLVRADAFTALGGFDGALTAPISFDDRTSGDLDPVSLGPDLGEDLDLCSRARIAGYTLSVEPTARVAHLGAVHGSRRERRGSAESVEQTDSSEPVGSPEPVDPAAPADPQNPRRGRDRGDSPAVKRIAPGRRALRYRERNRIRSAIVTAGNVRLPVILPVLSVQTIWRIISPAHHDVGWREGRRAWTSALRIQPPLRAQRASVQKARRVADRDDMRRLLPIGARARAALRADVSEDSARLWNFAGETASASQRSRRLRLLAVLAMLAVWVVGSRNLFLNGVPGFGQFAPFDSVSHPFTELAHSGAGGGSSAASPALLVLSVLFTIGFGARGFVQFTMTAGLLLVGAFGIWRLVGALLLADELVDTGDANPTPSPRPMKGADQPAPSSPIPAPASATVHAVAAPVVRGAEARARRDRRRFAQTVVTTGYLGGMVGIQAIAAGRLDALVATALFPSVIGFLLRFATTAAPAPVPLTVAAGASATGKRVAAILARFRPLVPFAVVLAVLLSFAPGAVVAVAVAAIVVAVWAAAETPAPAGNDGADTGAPVRGQRSAAAKRVVGNAALSAVLAAVLLLPWSVDLVRSGRSWGQFNGGDVSRTLALRSSQLLRLNAGGIPASLLSWGFVVVALVAAVLCVGRRRRLVWLGWSLLLVSTVLVWLAGRWWLGTLLPHPLVMLAPAGVGLALAAGLGASSLAGDVRTARFGWRQVLSLAALAVFALALVPSLLAARNGRWRAPGSSARLSLSWLAPTDDAEVAASGSASAASTGAASTEAAASSGVVSTGAAASTEAAASSGAASTGAAASTEAAASTGAAASTAAVASTEAAASSGAASTDAAASTAAVASTGAASSGAGKPADTTDAVALTADPAPEVGFRVVWIGSPRVLPIAGWSIDPDLSVGVSDSGLPTIGEQWLSRRGTAVSQILDTVREVRVGSISRAGAELAEAQVRYVVVVDQLVPTSRVLGRTTELRAALVRQFDLRPLQSSTGLSVFENALWTPQPLPEPRAPLGSLVARVLQLLAWAACGFSLWSDRHRAHAERVTKEVSEDGDPDRIGDLFTMRFDDADDEDQFAAFAADGAQRLPRVRGGAAVAARRRHSAVEVDVGADEDATLVDSLWEEWAQRHAGRSNPAETEPRS